MKKFADYAPRKNHFGGQKKTEHPLIREVCLDDAQRLAAIVCERDGGSLQTHLERFRDEIENKLYPRRRVLFVAIVDDILAGFARAGYVEMPEDAPGNKAPDGYYLLGVIIKPEYRRRGIAAELTRKRLAWIRQYADTVYYFCNAQNRVSIDLHAALGFQKLTEDFYFPGVRFEGGKGVLFRLCMADES